MYRSREGGYGLPGKPAKTGQSTTGVHCTAPARAGSRPPHAGPRIFLTDLHAQQLLGFSPPVSAPCGVTYHTCNDWGERGPRRAQRTSADRGEETLRSQSHRHKRENHVVGGTRGGLGLTTSYTPCYHGGHPLPFKGKDKSVSQLPL